MIQLHKNYLLATRNTFQMVAKASGFIETDNQQELLEWITNHPVKSEKVMILGGGSNILLTGDFDGLVIHPANTGIEVVYEDHYSVGVRAGAGAEWDPFVEWCINRGYSGLENLSLIPGTVGASPIQNIGAYGVEAGNLVDYVEVIDLDNGRVFNLDSTECHFGYRDSIFKRPASARWLVWAVTFRLDKEPMVDLSYEPLKRLFKGKPKPSIQDVRQAVMDIRRSKLPDPAEIGNAGSFFKNPVVTPCHGSVMKMDYPDMPLYPHEIGSVKLSAGWLIEQCGWKGFRDGPVGVYPEQALVLVNYGGANAKDIMELAEKIKASVKQRFNITLEPEIRVL